MTVYFKSVLWGNGGFLYHLDSHGVEDLGFAGCALISATTLCEISLCSKVVASAWCEKSRIVICEL